MMNKRIPQLILAFLMLLVAACSDNEVPPQQQFPFVPVDVEINVQDLRYQSLHNEGWLYVNGGVRGLLIIKEGTNIYRAYDRACPYHPRESCALVSMHSSTFYLMDDCCGSQFDKSGNVTKGPAQQPLFQYNTYQNGNFLIIRND